MAGECDPGVGGMWFAVFPTYETLIAQAIAAILVIGSYYAARHFGGAAPTGPNQMPQLCNGSKRSRNRGPIILTSTDEKIRVVDFVIVDLADGLRFRRRAPLYLLI